MCSFSDNYIWVGSGKLSLLLQEYSQLAVNLLTSSPKISDMSENQFFPLKLAQNDEKVR